MYGMIWKKKVSVRTGLKGCVCVFRVFTESGCCEIPLPPMVGPCSAASALFNKTTGAATGTVGVFTYDLPVYHGDSVRVVAARFAR